MEVVGDVVAGIGVVALVVSVLSPLERPWEMIGASLLLIGIGQFITARARKRKGLPPRKWEII